MKYSKLKYLLVLLVLCTTVVTIAAVNDTDQSAQDSEEAVRKALPVVKIDDQAISLGDFELMAKTQSPMLQQGLLEKEKRDDFLNKIINMELLATEARRRGYEKDSEVITVQKNQLATLMHKKIAAEFESHEPTEADMKAYYEDNVGNYKKPEKVRARHILVSDKNEGMSILADLLKKKVSQYEFRRLAQEKSQDEATKNRGGDLTFFTRAADRQDGDPVIDDKIVEAVFNLKENGSIHPKLIETDKGFHIVMRTGHRKAMNLSFEDAKDRLKQLVKRESHKEKTDKAIDALMEKYKVTLFEENLKDVVIDLSSGPHETAKSIVPPNAPKAPEKKN